MSLRANHPEIGEEYQEIIEEAENLVFSENKQGTVFSLGDLVGFESIEAFLIQKLKEAEKRGEEKAIEELRMMIAGNQTIDIDSSPLEIFEESVRELKQLKETQK